MHHLSLSFLKVKVSEVWDTDGKQYIDCISGFSVANQGHCHPTIVKAMTEQAFKVVYHFHVSFIVTISEMGRKNLSSC